MAYGGQIAVPLDIAQAFVLHCTGQAPAFTEDSLAGDPINPPAGPYSLNPEQPLPAPQVQAAPEARAATPAVPPQPSLAVQQSQASGDSLRSPQRQAAVARAVMPAEADPLAPDMLSNPMFEAEELAQQPPAPSRLRSVPPLLVSCGSLGAAETPLPSPWQRGASGLQTPRAPQGGPGLCEQRCGVHLWASKPFFGAHWPWTGHGHVA